ncbi:glucohydrolase [Clostridium paraputrificum]|uniref:Oligo-1,6-glucosidase n=1 Tax=Clostridium paraputrificum TaxID=29363 RepID=A0A6N3CA92_9CLOT
MDFKWWQECVFYEIYMPSFMDGNDDGIGDFKGITTKLEYLKELGVKGIWLTPFYKSPKIDNGYDIADYYAIDSDYGNLDDFKVFIDKAHNLGIKVIIDIVLNHTSSQHEWFIESSSSKDNDKRDYYIWKSDKPNNWESFFGGDSWEFDEKTNEYYYHAFAKEQVDLNWQNPKVYDAMKEVFKYWIELGVDGFRFDVINFLTVNDNFNMNNPYDKNGEQLHINDKDQDGIIDLIKRLVRDIRHMKKDIFLVGEVGSENLNELKEYTGKGLLDVVFNFNLGSIKEFSLKKIYKEISLMDKVYNKDQIPTLFFNSHDMGRSISRFNPDGKRNGIESAMAVLLLTSYGVPFMYFGEEIGIRDLVCSKIENMNDIQGITKYNLEIEKGNSKEVALKSANISSRDKSRGIMQWNNSKYYGFSNSKPWINIEDKVYNVSVETLEQDRNSLIYLYKELIQLRYNIPCLLYGKYKNIAMEKDILIFEREYKSEIIRVVINFGEKEYIEEFEGDVLMTSLKNSRKIVLNRFDFIILYRKE